MDDKKVLEGFGIKFRALLTKQVREYETLKKGDEWWINSPEYRNNFWYYVNSNSREDGGMKCHQPSEIAKFMAVSVAEINILMEQAEIEFKRATQAYDKKSEFSNKNDDDDTNEEDIGLLGDIEAEIDYTDGDAFETLTQQDSDYYSHGFDEQPT